MFGLIYDYFKYFSSLLSLPNSDIDFSITHLCYKMLCVRRRLGQSIRWVNKRQSIIGERKNSIIVWWIRCEHNATREGKVCVRMSARIQRLLNRGWRCVIDTQFIIHLRIYWRLNVSQFDRQRGECSADMFPVHHWGLQKLPILSLLLL